MKTMKQAPGVKRGADPERHRMSVRFSVKDAEKGIVEAVFCTFNVKDYDGDLTLPGAFEDGAAVAISAYGHKSWMGAMPVGRGKIRQEKERAVMEGQFFLNTAAGKETFEVVKAMDELQEWSYGFEVLETGEVTEDLRQKGVWRVLKKLKVFEVSPVLVGAGVDTGTLAVKDAGDRRDDEETPAEVKSAAQKEFVRFQQTRARLSGFIQ